VKTAKPVHSGARLDPVPTVTWQARAFGLQVASNADLGLLPAAGEQRLGRSVTLTVHRPGTFKEDWCPSDPRVLVDRSFRRGRPMMRVESDSELGYRIWAPGFGRHLVDPDGSRVRSIFALSDRRWERLLLAQPLPLAALLQGLELFHASAVEVDGRTLAFVAASGTGKTSVAAHLVASGAAFVTDDVLALERVDGGIVAHPGASILHLSAEEVERMTDVERERIGVKVGESDKVSIRVAVRAEPRRLAALYFLERQVEWRSLDFVELSPPEPRRLLASAFLSYLDLPSRLLAQLELCAELAAQVRAFEVRVPFNFGARALAAEVRRHSDRAL
jgi:hypothetical protein